MISVLNTVIMKEDKVRFGSARENRPGKKGGVFRKIFGNGM